MDSAKLVANQPPAADESFAKPQSKVSAQEKSGAADFADLYRNNVALVYRYFYRRTGNTADAEDLTSITFGKALTSLLNYDGRGCLAAWLFGIARYTLLNHRRTTRPASDIAELEPFLLDHDLLPEAQLLRREQLLALDKLVQQLPDDQREVVTLRLFAEQSTRDVAQIMGRSEAAVKMLLHRAITSLRSRFDQEK